MATKSIYTNIRWRLNKPLSLTRPDDIVDILRAKKIYRKNQKFINAHNRKSEVLCAVVIHLYYIESWSIFDGLLRRIKLPFDLYVTLPSQKKDYSEQITKRWPDAIVLEVPNRGRDVLPFLMTARNLKERGYEYVLKLHSKKSTHRKDGSDWFSEITNSLVPTNHWPHLETVLNDKDSAVVGPAGQYTSLKVNFEANGMHMSDILKKIYNRDTAYRVLQTERAEHGFFAGTMFWARLDALDPILLKNWSIMSFTKEAGQIDATIAHAIERVFCLVPQIEKKRIYEIGKSGIGQVNYDSGVIPDWADVYIGPKPG